MQRHHNDTIIIGQILSDTISDTMADQFTNVNNIQIYVLLLQSTALRCARSDHSLSSLGLLAGLMQAKSNQILFNSPLSLIRSRLFQNVAH